MGFLANIIVSAIWFPIGLLIQVAALVRFFSVVIVAKTIEAISGRHSFNISDEASDDITGIWMNGFRLIWATNRQSSDKDEFYNSLTENIIITLIVWVPVVILVALLSNSIRDSGGKQGSKGLAFAGSTQNINLGEGARISFPSSRSTGIFSREDYTETVLVRQIQINFGFWSTSVTLRVCNFDKTIARTPGRIQLLDPEGDLSNYAYVSGAEYLDKDECSYVEFEEAGDDFVAPESPVTGTIRIGNTELRL